MFRFVEAPGPYSVGLKVVEQYDYSRSYRYTTDEFGKPYPGERARPLQTLIWYPAVLSSATPMTVGDYGNLLATETSFGKPNMTADAKEWLSGMSRTLAMPLWAVSDAAPVSGRFPVVIYAPSFSAMSWENADLCEYLASHGYVIVASPDMGAASRDMTWDIDGINAQARDISFLIGYAGSLPNTDVSEVAVAGFSWGGISNLFAAARDNRIDALVALDGSLRYFPGLVKEAGDVHPEQMTIPLLYIAQGELTLEDQARYLTHTDGPSVLNAWTQGDLITVHMLALVHTEHSSMYQRDENVWRDFHKWQKADYEREDGITGYAWMARYTLAFLDAYLKRDGNAMDYLKRTPAQNGAPRHFMTANYRAAAGVPASFEGIRKEIGRQGFEHATDIYAAMLKGTPDFKLNTALVNAWADELISDNHLPEAMILLQLNVKIQPESSAVYASLGDAYAKANLKERAAGCYRASLEKDPSDDDVRKKLQELENGAKSPKRARFDCIRKMT